ncbi:hypothetical protein SBD_8012 [Streptomyces bottropensis ATCC 25435]|uniref:Uncharacterized protein n=1 Tax=Streptomyces bottropensis ATCC 25435 TaxID=1054862 RepID=M3EN42_9ACTN|nr:hypothetical protein SBD_8012 [Streptomyces bottropensis ATCC 25435]
MDSCNRWSARGRPIVGGSSRTGAPSGGGAGVADGAATRLSSSRTSYKDQDC